MFRMYEDLQKILITEEEINHRVLELAKILDNEYVDKNPLMVCVLKGSVIFFSDLLRAMTIPLELDFMAVSSYGSLTVSTGKINVIKDLTINIEGRHVIIVEDIADTGHTLKHLKRMLYARHPKSLKICALLNKFERREVELEPEYKGFDIGNDFVVGYGLDYQERYRNLPVIGILKEDVYTK